MWFTITIYVMHGTIKSIMERLTWQNCSSQTQHIPGDWLWWEFKGHAALWWTQTWSTGGMDVDHQTQHLPATHRGGSYNHSQNLCSFITCSVFLKIFAMLSKLHSWHVCLVDEQTECGKGRKWSGKVFKIVRTEKFLLQFQPKKSSNCQLTFRLLCCSLASFPGSTPNERKAAVEPGNEASLHPEHNTEEYSSVLL